MQKDRAAPPGADSRALLERMRDEVEQIRETLRRVQDSTQALMQVERERRLTTLESQQTRDLRLESEALRLRLTAMHTEFLALRASRDRESADESS